MQHKTETAIKIGTNLYQLERSAWLKIYFTKPRNKVTIIKVSIPVYLRLEGCSF